MKLLLAISCHLYINIDLTLTFKNIHNSYQLLLPSLAFLLLTLSSLEGISLGLPVPNILALRSESGFCNTGSFTVLGFNFNLGLCAADSEREVITILDLGFMVFNATFNNI